MNLNKIIALVVSWRVILVFFAFLGVSLLPLQDHYLGGGLDRYLSNPYIWSCLNFDGEHYSSIAKFGYRPLEHFFFPVYPLSIRIISGLFVRNYLNIALVGLAISNISFLLAIIGLYKLVTLDYKKSIATLSIILLLLFPTSYVFGSFFTESLYLVLVVWAFYFARTKKWLFAGILGMIASATRITGIIMFVVLLAEFLTSRSGKQARFAWLPLLLVPFGIISYMIYLYIAEGNPFVFITAQSVFGPQRAGIFVPLPQVFYRYIFKVLPSLDYSYLPVVFSTWLEMLVATGFLILSLSSFLKLRLSYSIYFFGSYLIPTFAGSFSSLPRYILTIFPAFILLALYIRRIHPILQVVIFLLLFISLGVATALFSRGYWVS